MANLLYGDYRTGCYVGASGSSLVNYTYGGSSYLACCYADLEPNTTYTLKRYDSSSKFRVATFTNDVKQLTGSGTDRSIQQWWLSDNNDVITFTTGSNDIHLVVYYTNESEYTTRIMLNTGSTPSDYEAPTKAFRWYMNGDQPTPVQAMPMADVIHVAPYPYGLWRIDESNDGMPYTFFMPDILYVPPHDPPPPVQPVKQRPYICLYRYDTPQDGFDGHGLFVLTPTKCTITEELNGRYEISMEHPIDAEGRWQYIRENNIIKAMGQLFTIRTVQQIWKGASGKIVAKGDHIFYQCGDGMIRRGETGITGTSVASICQEAVRRTDNEDREGLFHYQFTGISNMSVSQEYVLYYLDWLPQDTNMVDFIMGSRGMLEACEGELHRDNFDYSIYSRKQGTFDNAFDIRIGKNLTGIKRTIDVTTQATYLDAYNNYNWGISRDLTVSDMQRYGIPHHIVKRKDYSYNINVDGKNEEAEEWKYNIAKILLKMDSKRDFNNYCCPLVGYEIDMKEVKNNPDYSEVVDLGGYTVGNGGKLYDDYMGEIDIRITKTTTNAITGEVEQVTFGGLRTFVGQPAKTAVIDVEPEIVNIYFQVMDSEGALCFDRNGDMIIEYEGV